VSVTRSDRAAEKLYELHKLSGNAKLPVGEYKGWPKNAQSGWSSLCHLGHYTKSLTIDYTESEMTSIVSSGALKSTQRMKPAARQQQDQGSEAVAISAVKISVFLA